MQRLNCRDLPGGASQRAERGALSVWEKNREPHKGAVRGETQRGAAQTIFGECKQTLTMDGIGNITSVALKSAAVRRIEMG